MLMMLSIAYSRLLVSGDDQKSGWVMSRVWERKLRGNEAFITYNAYRLSHLLLFSPRLRCLPTHFFYHLH